MIDPALDVMVVDDVSVLRKLATSILRKAGLTNIRDAADGSAALKALAERRADLVISDLNMPGMGGLDLFRAMKSRDDLKDIRFILVTGTEEGEELEEARKAGITEFLPKPFAAKTLEAKLQAQISLTPPPRTPPAPCR